MLYLFTGSAEFIAVWALGSRAVTPRSRPSACRRNWQDLHFAPLDEKDQRCWFLAASVVEVISSHMEHMV